MITLTALRIGQALLPLALQTLILVAMAVVWLWLNGTDDHPGRAQGRLRLAQESAALIALPVAGAMLDVISITHHGYPLGTLVLGTTSLGVLLAVSRNGQLPIANPEIAASLRRQQLRRHLLLTLISAVPQMLAGITILIRSPHTPLTLGDNVLQIALTYSWSPLIALAVWSALVWLIVAPWAIEAAARRAGYTTLAAVSDRPNVLRGANIGDAEDM